MFLMDVNLIVKKRGLEGYIVFLLSSPSLTASLNRLIADI
jgi:hypothetical protein